MLNALIYTGEHSCTVVPIFQIPEEVLKIDMSAGIWKAPVGGDNHMGEFRLGSGVRVPTCIDEHAGTAFVYESHDPEQCERMKHVANEIRNGSLSH